VTSVSGKGQPVALAAVSGASTRVNCRHTGGVLAAEALDVPSGRAEYQQAFEAVKAFKLQYLVHAGAIWE
jgi:hypothetical protein